MNADFWVSFISLVVFYCLFASLVTFLLDGTHRILWCWCWYTLSHTLYIFLYALYVLRLFGVVTLIETIWPLQILLKKYMRGRWEQLVLSWIHKSGFWESSKCSTVFSIIMPCELYHLGFPGCLALPPHQQESAWNLPFYSMAWTFPQNVIQWQS